MHAADLQPSPLPLQQRVALVTGVSRRSGIGYAIARRLFAWGASVFLHHYLPHDLEQPWGADAGGIDAVLQGVRDVQTLASAQLAHASADLRDPLAPAQLLETALAHYGHLDILVCNHARSGADAGLSGLSAAMLDEHWAVNTRATLLLVQAYAAQHDGRPGGRVIMLTSGQGLGPMPNELAYAASKGALAAVTLSLADELAERGITVNTVNPGPVDTGYASNDVRQAVAKHFPRGRWGQPDDPARLIAWLASDDAAWITGQVLHSEGGFRRWAP